MLIKTDKDNNKRAILMGYWVLKIHITFNFNN